MKFLTSNKALYRMLRTIVQGILGVAIANLDALIASLSISDSLRPIIVALCMAILSPIMAEIGRATENQNAKAVGLVPFEAKKDDRAEEAESKINDCITSTTGWVLENKENTNDEDCPRDEE